MIVWDEQFNDCLGQNGKIDEYKTCCVMNKRIVSSGQTMSKYLNKTIQFSEYYEFYFINFLKRIRFFVSIQSFSNLLIFVSYLSCKIDYFTCTNIFFLPLMKLNQQACPYSKMTLNIIRITTFYSTIDIERVENKRINKMNTVEKQQIVANSHYVENLIFIRSMNINSRINK